MPFKARPVTEADIDAAREDATKILSMARAGVEPNQIAKALRLKTGAVARVVAEPAPIEAAPVTVPPAEPVRDARSGAGLGIPFETPGQTAPQYDGLRRGEPVPAWTAAKPDPEPAPEPPRQREPPPEWPDAPKEIWERPMPSDQAPTPTAGPFQGAYTSGSVYDVLYQILKEHSIPEAQSRGICRRFSHLQANDFNGLAKILADFSIRAGFRTSIVEAYKSEVSDPSDRSDPLGVLGGDGADPLVGFDDAEDRRFRRDLQRRLLEARVLQEERRARGFDQATAGTAGYTSPEIERLREEARARDAKIAELDRQLIETKHRTELDAVRTDLQRQLDDLRKGGAPPTSEEIESRARAKLTETVTTELSTRGKDVGQLGRTIRDKVASDPKLQRRVLNAIDQVLPPDDTAEQFGVGHQQPTDEELIALTNQLALQDAGEPAPGRPPGAPPPGATADPSPKFRRIPRPSEATPEQVETAPFQQG